MDSRTKIYTYCQEVSWGDMDALGHVNNAKYFEYCQEARILALQEIDVNLLRSAGPILLNASCTFLKPVIYPARITIDVLVHSPGKTSFMMDYDLSQGTQLMAKGQSKIVWVDYQLGKSQPLPEAILAFFT